MESPGPPARPLAAGDRALTRREFAAFAVLLAVAVALLGRAAAPSWTAFLFRTVGPLTFAAWALLYGWFEDRRPRPFHFAVSALVFMAAGFTAGAIARALPHGEASKGALDGLWLGELWLLWYARRVRRPEPRDEEARAAAGRRHDRVRLAAIVYTAAGVVLILAKIAGPDLPLRSALAAWYYSVLLVWAVKVRIDPARRGPVGA